MSHRNIPRPAQRYVCSAIDCRNGYAGAPASLAFAEGVATVDQQIDQLKRIHAWHVGIGRCECGPCAARHAVAGAMATVTSLESALRASLRPVRDTDGDDMRDPAGGSAAVILRMNGVRSDTRNGR